MFHARDVGISDIVRCVVLNQAGINDLAVKDKQPLKTRGFYI
jgi:hypothetical protein